MGCCNNIKPPEWLVALLAVMLLFFLAWFAYLLVREISSPAKVEQLHFRGCGRRFR